MAGDQISTKDGGWRGRAGAGDADTDACLELGQLSEHVRVSADEGGHRAKGIGDGAQMHDTLEAERHRAAEHVGRLETSLAGSQAQLAQAEARIAGLEHSCADLQVRLSDARAQASSAQSAADEHRDRANLAVDRVRPPLYLYSPGLVGVCLCVCALSIMIGQSWQAQRPGLTVIGRGRCGLSFWLLHDARMG